MMIVIMHPIVPQGLEEAEADHPRDRVPEPVDGPHPLAQELQDRRGHTGAAALRYALRGHCCIAHSLTVQ